MSVLRWVLNVSIPPYLNSVISVVRRYYRRAIFAGAAVSLMLFAFTFELPIRIEFMEDTVLSIKTFDPASGKGLWEHQMVIILPYRKTLPSAARTAQFSEQFPIENFVDIQPGDYVVHNDYGVGRYRGIEKIRRQDNSGTPCNRV